MDYVEYSALQKVHFTTWVEEEVVLEEEEEEVVVVVVSYSASWARRGGCR